MKIRKRLAIGSFLVGVLLGALAVSVLLRPRVKLPKELAAGCFLIVPQFRNEDEPAFPQVKPVAYLINKRKEVVHEWHAATPLFNGKLGNDGRLYGIYGITNRDRKVTFTVLDRDSRPLLNQRLENATYDFDLLDEERLLYIEKIPAEPEVVPPGFLKIADKWRKDRLVLFDLKQTKVVRKYEMYALINANRSAEMVIPFDHLMHLNSVRYYSTNPLTQRPSILVTDAHNSRLLLIDFETGEKIWRSPKGMVDFPHDAQLLENGDVLVMSNGRHTSSTSVLQINPRDDLITWKYEDPAKETFYSYFMGSAQRLPNGNTFLSMGMQGYVFEIDPAGRRIWNWMEVLAPRWETEAWIYRPIYRATHFSPDDPKIASWKSKCAL